MDDLFDILIQSGGKVEAPRCLSPPSCLPRVSSLGLADWVWFGLVLDTVPGGLGEYLGGSSV